MNELSLFENQENLMTTKELAEVLRVDVSTINKTVERLSGLLGSTSQKSFGGRPTKVFTEKQASIIKQEIQKHHNLASRQIDSVSTDYEMEMMTQRVLQYHIQKASEYKERMEIAEHKLEEQRPQIEVYQSICDSSTLQDLQTVAVTIGQRNIFKVLEADKIIEKKYTQDGQQYYKPMAKYTDYLVLRDGKAWTDNQGVKHIRPRIFVTGKGLVWLTNKYKEVA